MADFLSEVFDGASPEEQAKLTAADEAAEKLLTQGDAAVEARFRKTGPGDREYVLAPQDKARSDAACTVFGAYRELLWSRTDKLVPTSVGEYILQLNRVHECVLKRYGWWESQNALHELRNRCVTEARSFHEQWLALAKAAEQFHREALECGAEQCLSASQTPEFWRDRRTDFDRIGQRQHSILEHSDHDRKLKGYCFFTKESSEIISVSHSGGVDGKVTSDFEDIATEAGQALGCPAGVDPVDFWIYRLALDLLGASKPEIRKEFMGETGPSGIVLDLLASSSGYCSRLAAASLRNKTTDGKVENLPNLSEQTVRRLALQWDELIDQHHLTAKDIDLYASAPDRVRNLASSAPPTSTDSPWFVSWCRQHEDAKRQTGIFASVAVAKGRFTSLESEYWAIWNSPGAKCEAYANQMELLKRQVMDELSLLWKRSPPTIGWHERGIAPIVEQSLAELTRECIRQARQEEIRRLPASPRRTGNAVLDEIYSVFGDSDDAIRLLLQSGRGDELSPAAQKVLQLIRVKLGKSAANEASQQTDGAEMPVVVAPSPNSGQAAQNAPNERDPRTKPHEASGLGANSPNADASRVIESKTSHDAVAMATEQAQPAPSEGTDQEPRHSQQHGFGITIHRGKAGRPRKEQTVSIQSEWISMGRPELTAAICDKIGKQFFAKELKNSQPGSHEHKRVRERVRRAIQRSRGNPQHN